MRCPPPSLACRLGSCAPVGRVQDRPKWQRRPVRGRAPPALAHPLARLYHGGISNLAGAGGGILFLNIKRIFKGTPSPCTPELGSLLWGRRLPQVGGCQRGALRPPFGMRLYKFVPLPRQRGNGLRYGLGAGGGRGWASQILLTRQARQGVGPLKLSQSAGEVEAEPASGSANPPSKSRRAKPRGIFLARPATDRSEFAQDPALAAEVVVVVEGDGPVLGVQGEQLPVPQALDVALAV